eukprot:Nk52_evm26s1992 gene=Nk52_evmTU26s1992
MGNCLDCIYSGNPGSEDYNGGMKTSPAVELDMRYMGKDCVLVKNNSRVCGNGGTLANAPIVQDKAYFEVTIQAKGVWGVGVASRDVNLDNVPMGACKSSWVLRSDSTLCHNNEIYCKLEEEFEEGDVIGCSYNHDELLFYLNGRMVDCALRNVRGTVYPVFYVDQNAIVDVRFKHFKHDVPRGYQEIMFEQSVI